MAFFNAKVGKCSRGQQPQLKYEPGCYEISCERGDCRCLMADGDHQSPTPIIVRWKRERES